VVTLTATVTPVTATGKVTFYDGTTVLGTSTILSGTASLSTIMLPDGARALRAYYAGVTSNVIAYSVTTNLAASFSTSLARPDACCQSIVAADFNGDGQADLVMAGGSANDVIQVLVGNGNGSFQTPISHPLGAFVTAIGAGDFNGDGKLDLAVTFPSSDTVRILLGNGDGTFVDGASYPTGLFPTRLVLADFDGDGNADLAVANSNGQSVSILLGNGDGTFQARVDYGISNFAYSLAAGDFNRDGKTDLVVGSAFGSAYTLLGKGDGTFQPPVAHATGNQGAAVAVGDFNGDGNPDIAVVNKLDNTVSILPGNGDGTFLGQSVYPTCSNPQAIVLADFDGHGKIDLAVAGDTNLSVLPGNGNGAFQAARNYPISPRDPAFATIGDFNGDGKADLALGMGYVHILLGTSSALTVFPTHTADFYQGQTGTYTITVFNGQSGPTSDTVTITDNLPSPLTMASMTGTGWNCTGNSCSRFDTLAPGSSYPPITVVVNLPWFVYQATNQVTVSGGGSPDISATDPTNILLPAPAVPTLVSPANGATGVSLTPTMTWNATGGALSYNVLVTCASTGFNATVDASQTSYADTIQALGEGTACQWSVTAINPSGSTKSATWSFKVMGPQLTASPASAALGTPVTLTLQVFPPNVTGRVAFYDGVNLLGTKMISGGTASLTTIQLPAGNRKITAYLLGDIPSHNVASNVLTVPVSARVVNTVGSRGQIPVWNGPSGVVAADLNGDGRMDLAIAGAANQGAAGAVSVLLGNGDGTFQSAVNYPAGLGARDVAVGDLNGDGKPDLVVALLGAGVNSIAVLLGNGDGTFQSPVIYPAGAGPISVRVADLNQDGNADVVVADVASGVSVLLGNGNGTLQAAVPYTAGAATECVTVGDFNGDGKPDIAAVNASSNNISVLLGRGDGTFLPAVNYVVAGSPYFVAAGDFNGDGALDLAVTVFGGSVNVLRGNGDGTFQGSGSYAAGSYPTSLSIADLDGDGNLDLAVSNEDGTVVVLKGLGNGTFFRGQTIAVGVYPWSVAAADFNGDGATDLAVSNAADNNVSILLGVSGIAANGGTAQAVIVGTAFPASLDAKVTDAIGSPMSGIFVTFSAPVNGASAMLSGGTVTTNNLGIASVTATANTTAGSYSARASVGSLSSVFPLTNKVAALTVVPGTQSTLVGTSFPQALQVTVRDGNGNALSGMAVNFTAPASGASAVLSAGTANTNASGVATVTAIANLIAGSYVVSVNVPVFGLSGSFQLANQAVSSLTLTAPATAVLGTPINMTVVITPANATGKVAFYDGVTLLGTRTLSSGTASFSTVTLPAGLRKLSAFYPGDGVRLPATSNLITESVSAGASLGWAPMPTVSFPAYTDSMAVADLNRDGKADLVYANANGNTIGVLLGNGNGTFRTEVDYPVPGATWVGVADFNGDGIPDLAVSRSQNDTFNSSHFYILLGNGDGTFQVATAFFVTGDIVYPNSLAIGDFNGDGKGDLAFASSWQNRVAVYLGNGDGTFQTAVNYPATSANAIVVGDFNGDGKADLAVGSTMNLVQILLGNGDGTFRPAVSYPTAHPAYYVTAADFNNDGKLDLAIAEIGVNVAVFLGNGDGTLQPPLAFTTNSDVLRFSSADMNGDGKPDLIFGLRNSAITVQLGNGDGTFPSGLSYTTACTTPIGVVPGEFDGDGRADLAVVAGCSTAGAVPPGNLNVFDLTIMTGVSAVPPALGPVTMTSPVNGSTLASATVTFQWTAGTATQYGLWIGSAGVGSANLAAPPGGTNTSYTATGLPADGRTLYVRLWSLVNNIWQYSDYTYTAWTSPSGPVTMTSPVNGSTLASATVTFQWTAGMATQYGLWIGSAGVGSANLAAPPGGTNTSYTATGLPTDGRTIYARLWSLNAGVWSFQDDTYTAANLSPGGITSPGNGSTFTSSTVTFQWSGSASQFGLWIGSTGQGSSNLAAPPGTTATSYTAMGLPTDGRTIYVRLWSLNGGVWSFQDYTYTAPNLSPSGITSPANGSTFTSSTVTFQWSGSASQFGLWIGSTGPGSSNLATPPGTAATSYTAMGLPTDGRTIYVRLWSLNAGVWSSQDYTYTAENLTPGVIISPANGSTLTSSSVTFQWSAGGATQFGLWIGSIGPGSSNLATPPSTIATSFAATGLPTDGRTIYVRLWSLVNGVWMFNDYTYTAL
jgi:uncharacterized repeat protein (TIGR01451 family)